MSEVPGGQDRPGAERPAPGAEPAAASNGEPTAAQDAEPAAATGNGVPSMPPVQRGFERLLAVSRLLALIPVIFLLLDAAGSFVYGSDILVRTATGVFGEPAHVGGRLGLFLIVMDTFLVGATLMIAAFGFYELFVLKGNDEAHKFWLPGWLKMRDLEDLKARVVSMLILVAAITFVDRAVESTSEEQVLFLGVGISIIVAALTAFLRFGRRESARGEAGSLVAAGGPAGEGPAADSATNRTGAPPSAGHEGAGADATKRADDSAASAKRGSVSGPNARSDTQSETHAEPGRQRARITTILASTKRSGNSIATDTVVTVVGGWARLDLRDAVRPGQRMMVSVRVGAGGVSITIPPDMDVAESGMTLLGVRRIGDRRGTGLTDGTRRLLVLSDRCVLGFVQARRKALD